MAIQTGKKALQQLLSERQKAEDGFRTEIRCRQGFYNCMSQRKLADRLDIPQSTLSKWMAAPELITVSGLRKIVAGAKPDPRVILLLLGYSKKDITGV